MNLCKICNKLIFDAPEAEYHYECLKKEIEK